MIERSDSSSSNAAALRRLPVAIPPAPPAVAGAPLSTAPSQAPAVVRFASATDFWANCHLESDVLRRSAQDFRAAFGRLAPPLPAAPTLASPFGGAHCGRPRSQSFVDVPVVGGVEDEFYFACLRLKNGELPAYGQFILESPVLHMTCESDGDAVRPEVVTHPAVVGSVAARQALQDADTLRQALEQQVEPITLAELAQKVSPLLHYPLRQATRCKKEHADYGTYDAAEVMVWRDPGQKPHDVWRQQTFGVSLYVYANPGLLHFFANKSSTSAKGQPGRTPQERGERTVADVEFQEYPARDRLAQMYALADRARLLVARLKADLGRGNPAFGSLLASRPLEKLVGFFALVGQWLTYPSGAVPGAHWIAKERVLALPHTRLYEVFTQCLSVKDRAILSRWMQLLRLEAEASNKKPASGWELLFDHLLEAFQLQDGAWVAGNKDMGAREFLRHQFHPALSDGPTAQRQQGAICDTMAFYPPNRSVHDAMQRYHKGKEPLGYMVAEMRVAHGDLSSDIAQAKRAVERPASQEPLGYADFGAAALMVNPPADARRAIRLAHRAQARA